MPIVGWFMREHVLPVLQKHHPDLAKALEPVDQQLRHYRLTVRQALYAVWRCFAARGSPRAARVPGSPNRTLTQGGNSPFPHFHHARVRFVFGRFASSLKALLGG